MAKKCKVCNKEYDEDKLIPIAKDECENCENARKDPDYYLTKNYVCEDCIKDEAKGKKGMYDWKDQCKYGICHQFHNKDRIAFVYKKLNTYEYCEHCAKQL